MMTYPTPNWRVNRNGNTANSIRDVYMDVHVAAMALKKALQAVNAEALHGRNYQTVEHNEGFDRETMTDMLLAVMAIEEHATSAAARAIRQREGL
jgi:hypothetical protein